MSHGFSMSPQMCLMSAAKPLCLWFCPEHVLRFLWYPLQISPFFLVQFLSLLSKTYSFPSPLRSYCICKLYLSYYNDALSSNISLNFQLVFFSPTRLYSPWGQSNIFYSFLLIILSSWYPICFLWPNILSVFNSTIFTVYVLVSYLHTFAG